MLIRRASPFPIRSSEITPEPVFLERRCLVAGLGAGLGAGAAVLLSGCGPAGSVADGAGLPDAAAALANLEGAAAGFPRARN